MNESEILDPPVLKQRVPTSNETWKREYIAFLRMLPDLLKNHKDKYVAVQSGAVVAVGDTFADAALQAYARCGYVPLHVGKVTDEPEVPIRIPSPRIVRARSGL